MARGRARATARVRAGTEDVRAFSARDVPAGVRAYRALHNGLEPETVVVGPPPPPPSRYIVRLGRDLARTYAKDVDDHDGAGRKRDVPHEHPYPARSAPGVYHDARGALFDVGAGYTVTERGITDAPRNDPMSKHGILAYAPKVLRPNPDTSPVAHLAARAVAAGLVGIVADVAIDRGVQAAADAWLPEAWAAETKRDIADAVKIVGMGGVAYAGQKMDAPELTLVASFVVAEDVAQVLERKTGAITKLKELLGVPATTRGVSGALEANEGMKYFEQPVTNPSDATLREEMDRLRAAA